MTKNFVELLEELEGIDFSVLGEGVAEDQAQLRDRFDQLRKHCEAISESLVHLIGEWDEISTEMIPLLDPDGPDAMALLYGHNMLIQALIPISLQVTIWGLMCEISTTGADENSPEVAQNLMMIQILSDRLDHYIEGLEQ